MSIQKQWCLFSAGALVALGLGVSTVGCDREQINTDPTGAGGNNQTTSSSSSGTAGGGGGTAGGGGEAGSGGAGGGPSCGGEVVTIDQLTNPNATKPIGKGFPVTVEGVVAMSKKFLVSQSNSGSCLYGVFVSAPGITETKEYSGILVLSRGADASIAPGGTKAYCGKLSAYYPDDPLPGDSIPDDVKPGDVLNVSGTADSFLLNQCSTVAGGSKVAQAQISYACKVERTGTAAVPTPHEFTDLADIAKLASATDTDFHQKWGGVKVRISGGLGVVPQADPAGGSASVIVGSFGIIKVALSDPPDAANALQVPDKIYYRGYDNSICYAGPAYTEPTYSPDTIKFNRIDGFSYLNYCTWGLEPANRCADLDPASQDCGTTVCE